jgi:oligopeptide transport system substrate-binding protein
MNSKTLVVTMLAGLALGTSLPASATEHVLRLRGPTAEDSLDPALRQSIGGRVLDTIMLEGLTREDATGAPVPGTAASWEISSDGRRYTFHLRPGAKFSDGHPVTSADFLYALRRLVDPKTAAAGTEPIIPVLNARDCLAGKLSPDALGVAAPDPMTLVITLEHPDAFFTSWAVLLFPLEQEVVERWGREWVQPGHMVSNGPFVLADHVPHGDFKLTRNPTYWNAAKIRLNEVDFVAVNARTAMTMFEAGELDVVSLSSEDAQGGRLIAGAKLHTVPQNRTSYLFFNMRQGPLADSQPVRRALALTLDLPVLLKVEKVLDDPAFAVVPPQYPEYSHPREDFADWPMAKRIAEARRLYADAGYSDSHPLEFKFTYYDGKTCAALQEIWRASLGVKMTCDVVEDDDGRYHLGQFELGGKGESSAAPDARVLLDNLRYPAPSSVENEGAYNNPKFNELMDQAAQIADPKARGAKMGEAEAVALADQAVIPISSTRIAFATSAKVSGYQQLPSRSLFLDDVDVAP